MAPFVDPEITWFVDPEITWFVDPCWKLAQSLAPNMGTELSLTYPDLRVTITVITNVFRSNNKILSVSVQVGGHRRLNQKNLKLIRPSVQRVLRGNLSQCAIVLHNSKRCCSSSIKSCDSTTHKPHNGCLSVLYNIYG